MGRVLVVTLTFLVIQRHVHPQTSGEKCKCFRTYFCMSLNAFLLHYNYSLKIKCFNTNSNLCLIWNNRYFPDITTFFLILHISLQIKIFYIIYLCYICIIIIIAPFSGTICFVVCIIPHVLLITPQKFCLLISEAWQLSQTIETVMSKTPVVFPVKFMYQYLSYLWCLSVTGTRNLIHITFPVNTINLFPC